MKKERLKNGQSKIQMEEQKAVTKKEQLVKRKDAEKAKHSKVIQDILNHGNVLKSDIEKYIKASKDEVDAKLKTIFKSIDTDLSIVSKSVKYSNEKNTEVEGLIKSTDVANFFSDVRRMEKSVEVSVQKTQPSYNSIPKFVPGEITHSNFGELQSDSLEELSVALNIIQEYQIELYGISDIFPCVDNSIWIHSYLDSYIANAIPTSKKPKVISKFNMKSYGMSITISNNLLLSNGKSTLQQLNITTGKLSDTIYDVSPLLSTCIHITIGNKVIVGGYYDKLGKSDVFVMNEQGDHETVYEHDKHNQPIFTYPSSITSTSNGNIHVVDRKIGKEGRVVMLVPGSDVINSYKGHTEINKDNLFKPTRIVTTSRDNVMVIDLDTHTIHILDSKGSLVSWYNTKDIGILYPHSFGFTPTGQLYIGCGRQAGSTAKEAKIYEVNCSGC